ncbi:hypothetical protein GTU79_14075 [Sodalis ligni]|uniref:hypothetical protein n=1 Tax=Sodalis ligni TaxID=2697027 RepID=UPI001BDECCDC|nr:hypothetical protein [Sodalis ligni]QWA13598.1 hypothetical protein GTU79_14075 [Sodalis ligni]
MENIFRTVLTAITPRCGSAPCLMKLMIAEYYFRDYWLLVMLILLRSLLVSFFGEKLYIQYRPATSLKDFIAGHVTAAMGHSSSHCLAAARGWELILYAGGCMNPIRGGLWCLKSMSDYNSDTIFTILMKMRNCFLCSIFKR